MWEQIKINKLIEGKLYEVMDGQRFVVKATFEGDCFKNHVTKEIIRNPARVWQ